MLKSAVKGQTAVEFLATYTWTFVVLAIFVVVIASFLLTRTPTTYVPPTCYITPGFPCDNLILFRNSAGSIAIVVFNNNLGAGIQTPAYNSFSVAPAFSQSSYEGSCYPVNAPQGSIVECNATMQGFRPSLQSQATLSFSLSYELCTPACSPQIYNTSGSGTTFTTEYVANVINKVTVLASPSADGNVVVQGVKYQSNSIITLVGNTQYTIYAAPKAGKQFTSWSGSSNVVITSSTSQTTTVYAKGQGTLTATFT